MIFGIENQRIWHSQTFRLHLFERSTEETCFVAMVTNHHVHQIAQTTSTTTIQMPSTTAQHLQYDSYDSCKFGWPYLLVHVEQKLQNVCETRFAGIHPMAHHIHGITPHNLCLCEISCFGRLPISKEKMRDGHEPATFMVPPHSPSNQLNEFM